MKNLLVCSDLSKDSMSAFDVTRTLARAMQESGISVNLLYVVDIGSAVVSPEGMTFGNVDMEPFFKEVESHGRKCLERLTTEYFPGTSCRVTVVRSALPAYEEIIRFAKSECVDLIIMSKHGKSGLQRLLTGSTTTKVVQLAECPVIVVPVSKSVSKK